MTGVFISNFFSVTCDKSASSEYNSTKHRRFSLGTSDSSCVNTGPIQRGGPYWTSWENGLKPIELSSINKVIPWLTRFLLFQQGRLSFCLLNFPGKFS